MDIFQFTLPNILGYAAVGYLLLKALAHRSAVRELASHTRDAATRLDKGLPRPSPAGPVSRRAVARQWSLLRAAAARSTTEHPTAAVLMRLADEPRLADDELAIDAWVVRALQAHLGPLRRASEINAGTAAPIGLLGTIAGFVIGTYTFAKGGDTSALMGSIALALLTTFVASIVVLIERRLVKGTLEPLEADCALHAQEWVARARLLSRWQRAGIKPVAHVNAHGVSATPAPQRRSS